MSSPSESPLNANAPAFTPVKQQRHKDKQARSSATQGGRRKGHHSRSKDGPEESGERASRGPRRPRQPRPQAPSAPVQVPRVLDVESSIQTTDRKGRVSLNHLLNFSLPPRSSGPSQGHFSPSSFSGKSRRYTPSTPYSKERFVNAAFRFLVQPTTESPGQLLDPDMPLPWEEVERVIIPCRTTKDTVTWQCPICLGEPMAARITKCGHVFCYACILQYMDQPEEDEEDEGGRGSTSRSSHLVPGANRPALPSTPSNPLTHREMSAMTSVGSEGKRRKKGWKKCPICWDAIYPKDLRGVVWKQVTPAQEGKRHRFCLVQRNTV